MSDYNRFREEYLQRQRQPPPLKKPPSGPRRLSDGFLSFLTMTGVCFVFIVILAVLWWPK